MSAIGRLFGGGGGGASDDDDGKAVFAAKSRRQVRIPGFVFAVSPAVVNGEDADALAALEAAVASGATAVILADDTGDATTRELFNAALALKESLRGRAALLVADRTDIAASAECDGVVLSDDGVPVVVARKSLSSASGVVACGVKDEQAALIAAKEGADLILAPNGRVAEGGAREDLGAGVRVAEERVGGGERAGRYRGAGRRGCEGRGAAHAAAERRRREGYRGGAGANRGGGEKGL